MRRRQQVAVRRARRGREQGLDQRPQLVRHELVSKGRHGTGSCQTNPKGAKRRLRGLTDEQLQRDIGDRDQEALLPWCGPARTVEELVDNMLIGHIRLHRSSLKATVGR